MHNRKEFVRKKQRIVSNLKLSTPSRFAYNLLVSPTVEEKLVLRGTTILCPRLKKLHRNFEESPLFKKQLYRNDI